MDEWDDDPFWDDDNDDLEPEDDDVSKSTKTETKTAAEAIDLLREFCLQPPNGISWGVVMENEGTFTFYTRTNQPCYGEMRKYGSKSTRPEDYKPGDLHDPFPAGTPIAIGAPLYLGTPQTYMFRYEKYDDDREALFDYVFSAASPWRHVTGKAERLIGESKTTGCLITDTDVDPTAMVQFFMTVKNVFRNCIGTYGALIELGFSEVDSLLTAINVQSGSAWSGQKPTLSIKGADTYTLSTTLDIKRFLTGDIDTSLSKNRTLRQGEDYNRPKLHHVFGNTGDFFPKVRTQMQKIIEQSGDSIEKRLEDIAFIVKEARVAVGV